MFDWIKQKAKRKLIETMERELTSFVRGLKGADTDELAGILLGVNYWRNKLEAEHGWDLDHPELVEQEDIYAATKVSAAIREVQKVSPSMAPGLMVWLHSIRASNEPELRLLGREMWGEMARGLPHAPALVDRITATSGVQFDLVGVERVPGVLTPFSNA